MTQEEKLKRHKTICFLFLLLSFVGLSCCKSVCISTEAERNVYGVFLGISADEAYKLDGYDIVAVESSEFDKSRIERLHAKGKQVYGYINIGAIEEYRPYFERFKSITLAVYDTWPDERWVDVSSQAWQDFIVNELGKQYAENGFDGFFLDNADVYYNYPSEEIFQGLCRTLERLKAYGCKLIINGGDTFVSRCIDENMALKLFDGINQESVFTSIDFEEKKYGIQNEAETAYFKTYIKKAKNYGLDVYLLEYGANGKLSEQINAYCVENGFLWYNAGSLELK